MWQEETKKSDTLLQLHLMSDDLVDKNMPPIRGSSCSVALSQVKALSSDLCKHLHYIFVEGKILKLHFILSFCLDRI